MQLFLHRSWVEINIDNLGHNLKEIRKLMAKDTQLMACVKADAYGHGSVLIALSLERFGADSFGVSNINEAQVLRNSGVKKPILILGFTPPELAGRLASLDITQTILNLSYANQLSAAAKDAGVTLNTQIKVDTGMSRIGFFAGDVQKAVDEIQQACRLPNLNPVGIYTHYAAAEEQTDFGRQYTENQHMLFAELISGLAKHGISFASAHCCNSAGAYFYPESQHSLVRAGIMLYGLSPANEMLENLSLRPVMALKSSVSMVKDIPPGSYVSYGCRYKADGTRRIATVPLGYADGYPRRLAGKAKAFVNGVLVPVVGTICMDQLMLDVTGMDVKQDDTVTFFGGDSPISLHSLALLADTISYELCCGISRRIPRVYLKGGEILDAIDYTL